MKQNFFVLVLVVFITTGCSTASKDITETYVSSMQYRNYDCSQLTAETHRIHSRVNQMAGRLDESASNDKVLTGLGIILF